MARNKKIETEDQPQLIETAPKNEKQIISCARKYKKAQSARVAALEDEIALKHELLELVKEAKLEPLEGGSICFKVNGMTISVTPRDELVKVKEDGDGEE